VSTARRLTARIVATVVLLSLGVLVMNLPALFRRGRGAGPNLGVKWFFADSAAPAAEAPAPESAAVVAALQRVMDPELDLSIVDMGLLDSLSVDSAGNVRVVLLLTTPECPYSTVIGRQVVAEIRRLDGARRIQVRLEPNGEWEPERLTEEGRRRFRELFGDGTGTGR
jgi:metal-sulfur cluster biosynthetic enzyme